MVAVLQPIARAIERPAYDNEPTIFCLWFARNEKALRAYYAELGKTLPADADDNLLGLSKAQSFIAFAQVQWDIARGRF